MQDILSLHVDDGDIHGWRGSSERSSFCRPDLLPEAKDAVLCKGRQDQRGAIFQDLAEGGEQKREEVRRLRLGPLGPCASAGSAAAAGWPSRSTSRKLSFPARGSLAARQLQLQHLYTKHEAPRSGAVASQLP